MATVMVLFKGVLLDREEDIPPGPYLHARIALEIAIDGQRYEHLTAEVKQPVGKLAEGEPLEVSKPAGYDGPYDQRRFAELAEAYYRSIIGPDGRVLETASVTAIPMDGRRCGGQGSVSFDAEAPGP